MIKNQLIQDLILMTQKEPYLLLQIKEIKL
jgi:hypothetical protein